MSTDVAVRTALPTTSNREDWTEEQAAAIEAAGLVFTYPDWHEMRGSKVIAPRPIVARFLHTCERTGLDPLARQIYCIPRLGKGGIEWGIQTGIDGFRVVAERSKKYAGQDAAEWLTHDQQWVDVWIREVHGQRNDKGEIAPDAHPLAARVRVYRHDWKDDKPAVGIATWDEYVQVTSKGEVTSMWRQRGPGQLAKCAEALSLRKGFPQDLSGLYTDDEMAHATVLQDLSGEPEEPQEGRPARKSRLRPAESRSEAVAAPDGVSTADEPETASDEAVELPVPDSVESADFELEECGRCGAKDQPASELGFHAQLCKPCEAEVEAEIQEAEAEAEALAAERDGE
jgi:phage recombination protein Bet